MKNVSVGISSLLPIALTPEILDKCGFVKDSKTGWWFHSELGLSFADTNENAVIFVYDVDKNIRIGYLHDLQNFVYAFSGEELTYV